MKWLFDRAWQHCLLAAVLASLLLGALAALFLTSIADSKQRAAREVAQTFASRISLRTTEVVAPVYMLAALVKEHRGYIPDFEQSASDLLQEFPLARALELAPGGIVRQVFPLRGNEMILGHDLLKDPERNKDVHLAVARRELMLAGPFELKQGGFGAVARYPVFMRGDQGKESFWGFAIALIHVHEMLSNAGTLNLERNNLEYQICRINAETGECKVFANSWEGAIVAPVTIDMELPLNRWRLSVAPRGGWIPLWQIILALSLVILGAGLAAYYRYQAYAAVQSPLASDAASASVPSDR